MDKSNNYIKMCEVAKEIQKGYESNRNIGDFVYELGRGVVVVIREREDLQTEQNIWLPKQDQLQDMIQSSGIPKWWSRLKKIYEFANKCKDGFPNYCFASMEQLLLAFVMCEKYNKKWTGKDWRKSE